LAKGFSITLKHLFGKKFTRSYPEVPTPLPERYRGMQKLNIDEEGRVKCVACFLCETNCPADAIRIEAAPAPWPDRDKYPSRFDLDLLRCVFCGYCEEACPIDAIVLTNKIPPVHTTREAFVLNKEQLLKN
jgi:NADH-quinone oxidoreductase subunit I